MSKVVMRLWVALVAFVFGVPAFAALPAGVDTAIAAIQTDATALMALVVPVFVAILGMVIVLKLVKRFVGKI